MQLESYNSSKFKNTLVKNVVNKTVDARVKNSDLTTQVAESIYPNLSLGIIISLGFFLSLTLCGGVRLYCHLFKSPPKRPPQPGVMVVDQNKNIEDPPVWELQIILDKLED